MTDPRARARATRLAWLLDSSIPIPGTRYSIGLDPLLGLLPGIGDAIGVLLSSFILREAAALGAPKSVLLRMGFNVALEGLIGMIPLVGDVFDAAFKANQRNVRLLDEWLDNPRPTTRASRTLVGGTLAAVIAFLVLVVALGVLLALGLWSLLAG